MSKPVDIEKLKSIAIGASATPTRKQGVQSFQKREDDFSKDAPAYRRLRRDGLQPPKVDGSAEREARANTRYEVEG